MSNVTSVPLRTLPRSTQVPAGINVRLNRRAEHGRLRRGLKRKAYALPSNRSEFRDHVVAAGVINGVRRTELARKLEAAIVNIDGDDGVAAGDLCRHQACMSSEHFGQVANEVVKRLEAS
jgi:hypothetical protein